MASLPGACPSVSNAGHPNATSATGTVDQLPAGPLPPPVPQAHREPHPVGPGAGSSSSSSSSRSSSGGGGGGGDTPPGGEGAVLRVLDLFSGIGGMHLALRRVPRLVGADIRVTAVDINTTANRVYEATFGVKPRALDLTRLTAAQLDALDTDLWLLTPPCQPYTTGPNARRRDTADPRAAALLHLLRLLHPESGLPALERLPARVLLENVPGFVGSESHGALRGALAAAGYEVQEFVVSPHQLGVPYSRPRYFVLALRRPLRFAASYDSSAGPVLHPPAWGPNMGSPPAASSTADGSGWAGPSSRDATHRPGWGPLDDVSPASTPTSSADHQADSRVWPGVYDAGPDQGPESAARRSPYFFKPRTLAAFLESTAPGQPLSVPLAVVGSAGGSDPHCCAAHATPITTTPPAASCSDSSVRPEQGRGEGDGSSCSNGRYGGDGGNTSRGTCSPETDPWVTYAVPVAQLARFWRVLDVVTPDSPYCNCFTKHYADNVRGAGSVLASRAFAERFCIRDARGRLHFATPPPLQAAAQAAASVSLPRPDSSEADGGRGAGVLGGDAGGGRGPPLGSGGLRSGFVQGGASGVVPPRVVPVVVRPRAGGSRGVGRTRVGRGVRRRPEGGALADTAPDSDSELDRLQDQEPAQETRGRAGDAVVGSGPQLEEQQGTGRSRKQGRGGGGAGRGGLGGDQDGAGAGESQGVQGKGQQQPDQQRQRQQEEQQDAAVLGLRFFSPAEVAAIHGLPGGWADLADRAAVQPRQQYGLLGNGLSTDVVAHLLAYLFSEGPGARDVRGMEWG